jgi:hypothetical protein
LLLAAVAGGVDAVALVLFVGMFVSYMTGNSIETVTYLALGRWSDVLPRALPIPMFIGIFTRSSLIEIGVRRNSRIIFSIVLGMEAVLQTLGMVVGGLHFQHAVDTQVPSFRDNRWSLTPLQSLAILAWVTTRRCPGHEVICESLHLRSAALRRESRASQERRS